MSHLLKALFMEWSDAMGLPRMIRRPELKLIVPIADSTIYEMEQRGEFPLRTDCRKN